MSLSWQEVLDNLRPHKSDGVVAVHKPLLLLMILARAQQRGENEFPFNRIIDTLDPALRDLGQSESPPRPEYPYWRLRTDGCWVIDDEDFFLGLMRADGPTRKDFLDNDAVAHVPDDLWRPLLEEAGLIERLAGSILNKYFPDPQSRQGALHHSGLQITS